MNFIHLFRDRCLFPLFYLFFAVPSVYAQAPALPSNLQATIGARNAATGKWSVSLTWQDQSNNETGFAFFVLVDEEYQYLGQLGANATSANVSGVLGNGETLVFAMVSFLVDGISSELFASPYVNFPAVRGPDQLLKFADSGTALTALSDVSLMVTNPENVTNFAGSGMPEWLSIDPLTGALSGIPTHAGVFPFTVAITYNDGWVLNGTYTLRVKHLTGPPVVGSIIPAWNGSAGTSRITPLHGSFIDAEAESAVRMTTTLGTMDFILFDSATPATVANFMHYVNSSKYTDVVFHRSIPNFVVQAGGFQATGTANNFTSVVTNPPVVNEPGISNLRGTISMAKLGGNPNSATSQFFVSTNDNAGNLDFQNGGFTVFGRVAGNGMVVADQISALPRATYGLALDGSSGTVAFSDFPMNDTTAPEVMDQTKVVKILSASPIPTLSYSITGNTDPAVATASIAGGELQINGLSGGETMITVTATDLDQLTQSQQVMVSLTDTYSSWAARTTFPNGENSALQNPDGDSFNNLLEYAFRENPAMANVVQWPLSGSTPLSPSSRAMTLEFPVRKFTDGTTYVVEANDGLDGAWQEIWKSSQGFSHPQIVSAVDQAEQTLVTVKDSVSIGSTPRRFIRVMVRED